MINKHYLDEEVFSGLKSTFNKEKSIQLRHFLETDFYIRLLDRVKRLHYIHHYDPVRHSYSSTSFNHKKFLLPIHEFVSKLVSQQLKLSSADAFCFQHRDYTLLDDKLHENPGLMVLVELTPRWSDSFCGYTSFVKNNQEVLRILPHADSLAIIATNSDMKRFVKYINNTADRSRRYFLELHYM